MNELASLFSDASRAISDPIASVRGSRVIADDNFLTGNNGFGQLFTPNSAAQTAWGTVSWISGRGPARMVARTPNVASASVMAIKRMPLADGVGRYLLELKLSIENVTALTDRPQYFDFGCDTALSDGTRRYFKVRFLNYDQALPGQIQKFQLYMGTGPGYVTLPGPVSTYSWMTVTNENKSMQVYMALMFNTLTGKYEGFRFNQDISIGKLSITNPLDTSMQNLAAISPDALPSFCNGINTCVEIVNRTDASQTASCIGIHAHRLTYFGSGA